ncbi:HAD hydrolase-like protein, partial [Limosilactobacillus fermentum]|uniref:HAD family hydrolase n=2 Tax=Lactobacillaceae TaxID=33958 RepID=UPI00334C7E38
MNTFIFDIDGTLLDNVEGYLYGLQKTLRRHGREIAIQDLTWTNGRAGVDSLKELGFSPAEIPVVHEEWREDSKAFLNHVTWFPNMQKVLTQLSRHYKLGLVTSKDKPQFLEEDKKYHFSPYFETVVVAGEAKRNKPFGDPITLA